MRERWGTQWWLLHAVLRRVTGAQTSVTGSIIDWINLTVLDKLVLSDVLRLTQSRPGINQKHHTDAGKDPLTELKSLISWCTENDSVVSSPPVLPMMKEITTVLRVGIKDTAYKREEERIATQSFDILNERIGKCCYDPVRPNQYSSAKTR